MKSDAIGRCAWSRSLSRLSVIVTVAVGSTACAGTPVIAPKPLTAARFDEQASEVSEYARDPILDPDSARETRAQLTETLNRQATPNGEPARFRMARDDKGEGGSTALMLIPLIGPLIAIAVNPTTGRCEQKVQLLVQVGAVTYHGIGSSSGVTRFLDAPDKCTATAIQDALNHLTPTGAPQ